MAITYVDSAVQNNEENTSTFSVTVPGTVAAGDIAIIQITLTNGTAAVFTPPTDSVSLWTPVALDSSYSQAWYKVLATVPGSLSVTLSAARQGTLAVMFFRGVNTSDPLSSAVGVQAFTSGQASGSPPSVSTDTDGSFICGGLVQGSGTATWTPPSGWTIRVDGTRRNGILATKGIQSTAGATGTATWTMPEPNASWQVWQVALNPSDPPESPLEVEAVLTADTYPGFSGDIADGVAIVPLSAAPGGPFVITTNKEVNGGLYVMDIDGNILSSNLDGAANSVDWRDLTGVAEWDNRLLVMTVDRDDDLIRYYWMNRTSGALTSAGSTSLDYEPYGSCLYLHSDGSVYAFISDRGAGDTGTHNVRQYLLTRSSNTVSAGSVVRTISDDGVMEGLATDDVGGHLFVSREDHGLYRYSAAPGGSTTPTTVDTVGGGNLIADVEDVAIQRSPVGNFILVSSQGDNSYHVYDLDTLEHLQRFTVLRPGGSSNTSGTDGLDFNLTNLGPEFPNGLIVVHDDGLSPISGFQFIDASLVFGSMTPTITTSDLESPAGRWHGKATYLSWWNGSAWGAILPTDWGHILYPDLENLSSYETIVDGRQDSRVTVIHSGGVLNVLRGHGTSTLFSAYNSSNYSLIVSDAEVPLTSANLDASPITLIVGPNGSLWAATLTSGNVQVSRSTDGGSTWDTAQTIATVGSGSGVVGMAVSGADVVLVAMGNDGSGRAVRSIAHDASSYGSEDWTTETLPALASPLTSDDHMSIATLPDGRVLVVSKTTGATTSGEPLLYTVVRSTSGTWTSGDVVAVGPDSSSYTRPNLAIEPGAVRVIYGHIAEPQNLYTRIGLPDDIESQQTLDDTGNRSDSAVVPAGDQIAAAPGDYPVLTHDRDTGDIDILWITPAEAPVPETSVRLGTVTITAVKLGETDITTFILGG